MKSLRGSAVKRAAALPQTSDFQWIPTLWHFNKTLSHRLSAIWQKIKTENLVLVGRDLWAAWNLEYSPVLFLEASCHPLWSPNWSPEHAKFPSSEYGNNMQTVVERLMTEGTQRLAVWLMRMPWASRWWTELFWWFILQSEMRSQCWCPPTTRPADEWEPSQQLHKRADGTPDNGCKHDLWGTLNLCIQSCAGLRSYRPALLPKVLDAWDSPMGGSLILQFARIDSCQQHRATEVNWERGNHIDHSRETGSIQHPVW